MRKHISGNRCERGLKDESAKKEERNLFLYKRKRVFSYPPLPPEDAPHGTIGIPRVLNLYGNFPFLATFFRKLGFHVVLSPLSDRSIYESGMASIPSESACYPAKLAHGHLQWLIDQGVRTIFYPSIFYERKESATAQDHYNCPLVVGFPDSLKNSVEALDQSGLCYLHPFFSFTNRKLIQNELADFCRKTWGIPRRQTKAAAAAAWEEQLRAKNDVRAAGEELCWPDGLITSTRNSIM